LYGDGFIADGVINLGVYSCHDVSCSCDIVYRKGEPLPLFITDPLHLSCKSIMGVLNDFCLSFIVACCSVDHFFLQSLFAAQCCLFFSPLLTALALFYWGQLASPDHSPARHTLPPSFPHPLA
jgi:hypothetical protein